MAPVNADWRLHTLHVQVSRAAAAAAEHRRPTNWTNDVTHY